MYKRFQVIPMHPPPSSDPSGRPWHYKVMNMRTQEEVCRCVDVRDAEFVAFMYNRHGGRADTF
jgi:hypothetical protein